MRAWIPAVAVVAILAGPLFAAPGAVPDPPPKPDAPTTPSTTATGSNGELSTSRQEAEQTYALAYEELAKAKKDLEAGKAKNAEKKFKRVLERAERAVALDARYHEAWNLAGYAARKLGDYDRAFAAYGKCLDLKPDYAPAREYLGQAWLERDNVDKARDQLLLMEKFSPGAPEITTLRGALETYATTHPVGGKAAAAEPETLKTEPKK